MCQVKKHFRKCYNSSVLPYPKYYRRKKGDGCMYAEFVRDRITKLRLQKGVSEYKMSYDLGHSRGYINNISSGKTLPSMCEFFAICDYFGISPAQFFNTDTQNPVLHKEILEEISGLNESDLELTLMNIKRLNER